MVNFTSIFKSQKLYINIWPKLTSYKLKEGKTNKI